MSACYCLHCGGWGLVKLHGETEACPKCQDIGLCPRCLSEMDMSHIDSACPSCGWKWGDTGIETDNDPAEWQLC